MLLYIGMMQNTQTVRNNLKESAKHYVSGVMELIQYEAVSKLEKLGMKAFIFILMFVSFILAAGWLTFSFVTFLTRFITLESASSVMGVLLLLGGYLLLQSQKSKASDPAREDHKIESPQKQILLNQIEGAKNEFLDSAKEVKSITLETLNPAKTVKTVATNNPGAILLGGFALGVFLGTKNMRARPVRFI